MELINEEYKLNNHKNEKAGTIKIERNLNLIANFENGYALGWFFAVGECFKDQLDIKFPQRVEKMKKNKSYLTQGPFYCFSEGQVIYDTPNAYLEWCEALKFIRVKCEVLRSTPNKIDDNISKKWSRIYQDKNGNWFAKERSKANETVNLGKSLRNYIHGSITFLLSIPNRDKTNLESAGQHHCTQFEFVEFLKTGKLREIPLDKLITDYQALVPQMVPSE
jgi:hypothetical protein